MILGENEVCVKRSYLILNFIILRSIKKKQLGLDFLVEKLTNSIKNVATKDRFLPMLLLLHQLDFKKTKEPYLAIIW